MSLSAEDIAARDALRARQGAGARYDAATAPAEALLGARRGAAFFARKLNELPDAGLAEPSLIAGQSRAHVVAGVSYRARAMAIALKALRDGLTDEEAAWRPDVALAATLPARALRSLYAHSDVHLNVEFRDLPSELWDSTVKVIGLGEMPVRGLPLHRARDVWQGAVDLANGAGRAAIPAEYAAPQTDK